MGYSSWSQKESLSSVDQGWKCEPDWIVSSYHGARRSGVRILGMMSRPTKARATHFLSLSLIFPCCKWRLTLFLEVLWMDWSGRKISSNTKHCRHFRSYYDQICCLRTLHGDLGSLTYQIKGKKRVHRVGLCWTECLLHKEGAGICVWVVKPWRQHAYTLVYREAWLPVER